MVPQEVAALFERFGSDTVSSQALESGLSYWIEEEACVAYKDTGRAWIAVGAPLCAASQREAVMGRFLSAAREAGRRARFFCVEEGSEDSEDFRSIAIGEQPEWDPKRWSQALASKASLREQLRRAKAKKVVIRELRTEELDDHALRGRICRMVRDWQKNCPMAPMSFLVSLDIFSNPALKRYFVAEREGQIQAILVAAPIPARKGWFFRDVLRAHDAPNGTVELLFDHAMKIAASESVALVSYGLAPLSGPISSWLARVRDRSQWLYDFEGLRSFKAKLLPTDWRTVYLSFPRKERGVRATIDSLTAFADNSWLRFGLRTLVHAQPTLIWWLAFLLLPWTAILIGAPSHWFPSPAIKAAWVAFDLLLFLLLIHLALDWRRRTAQLLAGLSALDAGLGLLQLLDYNRTHLHSAGEWLLALLAVAAPLGASIILALGAAKRDRLYLAAPRDPPPA